MSTPLHIKYKYLYQVNRKPNPIVPNFPGVVGAHFPSAEAEREEYFVFCMYCYSTDGWEYQSHIEIILRGQEYHHVIFST